MCGGWPSLAEITVFLNEFLCTVPVMPKTVSALLHNAPYSPFVVSNFFPLTNMIFLEIATHAVHFVECNDPLYSSSGVAVTQ